MVGEALPSRDLSGMAITFRHLKNMLPGRTKVTMQYPEQKWDSHLPDHYRGAPALVKDETGACAASPVSSANSSVRRARSRSCRARFPSATVSPRSRNIRGIRYRHDSLHLLRDVRGGLSRAGDFLRKDYAITGYTRDEMVHHKKS
jgi:NADH-quinone oxidoreductase subunit I